MKYFKTIFNSTDWDLLAKTLSTNDSYNIFLERFIKIYDQAFPERKIDIKQKNLLSPWIKVYENCQKRNSVYMKFF